MKHMEKNNIERLEDLIQDLSKYSGQEIAAAIAMLPDYLNDGLMVVAGAAARVFAEHFQGEALGEALEQFRLLIDKIQKDQTQPRK